MSISHFFRILWVRRNLILLTTITALAAAVLVIKLVPARYTATSRVMLDIVKPDPVTGVALSSTFARAFVATQIELIRDYRVAGRVVDAFDWTSSPALNAAYRASNPAPDMSFRRWMAEQVIAGTDAELLTGSNILEIKYTSDNPDSAAKIADAVRVAYEDETRLMKQRGATRSADWFENQTRKLRAQLAEAEKLKSDFERANDIVIDDNMADAETARLQAMAGVTDAPAMAPMAAAVPVTSPSQAQLQQMDVAIESAMATLGPNHPRLVALRQQRAALASSVSQELAAARAAARAPVMSSGPSAASRYAQQQAKVLAQRGKVAEGRQLAVNANVLREQVAAAAKRTVELRQESESTETGMSFLGNAVAPKSPSFPNVPLITLGAIALGLGIGIALSILVELLNRKIRGPSDLEMFGIPMLGMAAIEKQDRPENTLAERAVKLLPFRREAAT